MPENDIATCQVRGDARVECHDSYGGGRGNLKAGDLVENVRDVEQDACNNTRPNREEKRISTM